MKYAWVARCKPKREEGHRIWLLDLPLSFLGSSGQAQDTCHSCSRSTAYWLVTLLNYGRVEVQKGKYFAILSWTLELYDHDYQHRFSQKHSGPYWGVLTFICALLWAYSASGAVVPWTFSWTSKWKNFPLPLLEPFLFFNYTWNEFLNKTFLIAQFKKYFRNKVIFVFTGRVIRVLSQRRISPELPES